MKASQVLEYVKAHITEITAEQIGKCHKVFGPQGSFYLVENEAGKRDEHGILEYAVTYSKEYGFQCTCKSGQYGFANVKHENGGVCKHVKWALAATIEEANALAALQRRIEEERKAAMPIEVKWNLPAWMFKAPVAPHMKNAPKER